PRARPTTTPQDVRITMGRSPRVPRALLWGWRADITARGTSRVPRTPPARATSRPAPTSAALRGPAACNDGPERASRLRSELALDAARWPRRSAAGALSAPTLLPALL